MKTLKRIIILIFCVVPMVLMVGCINPNGVLEDPPTLDNLIDQTVPKGGDFGDPKDYGVIVTYNGISDEGFGLDVAAKNIELATELAKMVIGRFGNNPTGYDGVGSVCYHSENCGHDQSFHSDIPITSQGCNEYQIYSTVASSGQPKYVLKCTKAHNAEGHIIPAPYPNPNPPYDMIQDPAPGQDHETTFNSINEDNWIVNGLAVTALMSVEDYIAQVILQKIETIAGNANEAIYSGILDDDIYTFADMIYLEIVGTGKGGNFQKAGSTKTYSEIAVDGQGNRIYYNLPESRQWWVKKTGTINNYTDVNKNGQWDRGDIRTTGFKNYVGNLAELMADAMDKVGMISQVDYEIYNYEDISDSIFTVFKDKDGNEETRGVYKPGTSISGPYYDFSDIKSVIVYNKNASGTVNLDGISAVLNASEKCDVMVYYRTVSNGVPQMPFTLIEAEGETNDKGEVGESTPTFKLPSIKTGSGLPFWYMSNDYLYINGNPEGEANPDARSLAVAYTDEMGLKLRPFAQTLSEINNNPKACFKYQKPIKQDAEDKNNYGLNVSLVSGGDYVEMIFQVVPNGGTTPKIALYMGTPTVPSK